jgi:hypothetical protein
MTQSRPWLRYYGKVPHSLDYPEITLYDAVAATAARVPNAIAWDFLGRTSSYRAFGPRAHPGLSWAAEESWLSGSPGAARFPQYPKMQGCTGGPT